MAALELELVGAAPAGTTLRVDADAGGQAVVWAPYWPLQAQTGQMSFVEAEGSIAVSGDAISGRLTATLGLAKPRHGKPPADPGIAVSVEGTVKGGVVRGMWRSSGSSGPLHGFVRAIPPGDRFTLGCVTLDRAYPFPGREGATGYNGLQTRLGGSFALDHGKVTEGVTGPNQPKASWFPGRAFRPTTWRLPSGQSVTFAAAGYSHGKSRITGSLEDDTLSLKLTAEVERQPKPVVWDVQLKRAGTLWYGTWKWTVAKGKQDMGGVAAGRVIAGDKPFATAPKGDTPREKLLRHAIALANHPGNVVWRDDLLAMCVAGTGNKQYDNPPNNVAGAIHTGLLLHRLSDDPMVRAEGLAMARRAAYWWHLSRIGPYRVGEYYKGMFWTTAWAGLGLAELSETDPEGLWRVWAHELAQAMVKAQIDSGAWTWIDENTGEKGKSNERNDRSKDDRDLNCGDLLLAMTRTAKAAGLDVSAAEARADTWLTQALAEPSAWHYLDRRPGKTPCSLGTVCWLQWLVERPEPDAARIARVRSEIEERFLDEKTGFLLGYAPRWSPRDERGHTDLSVTARYAHILAVLGQRGDADALKQTRSLIDAILKEASPESGLIDYLGRDLPADAEALGKVDAHAYLCMKAAIGWELLEAIEVIEDK